LVPARLAVEVRRALPREASMIDPTGTDCALLPSRVARLDPRLLTSTVPLARLTTTDLPVFGLGSAAPATAGRASSEQSAVRAQAASLTALP
jgi:hypothetical protein